MTQRTKYQAFEPVEVNRSELKGAPYNPRSIAPTNRKRLRNSIKDHGLVDGIVWNRRTGNVVGGHQRLSQIDELEGGQDYTITVQAIDVDETQEMQINLALNNKNLQGQFEQDLLKGILSEFVASGVDLEPTGYSPTDVQVMYPDILFAAEAEEQADAEANDVAIISNMANSGKAHEDEFRSRMGLDAPGSASTEESGLPDDAGDESESDSSDDADADQQQRPEKEHWTQPKSYFQDKRQGVIQGNAPVKSETDAMITLAFQTVEQMYAFMAQHGLDPAKRYFGVTEIQVAFGDLPQA